MLATTDLDEVLNTIFDQFLKLIDEFLERGSGWVLHELLRIDLHTFALDPLRGSTYIPLPDELLAKHALINIQNQVSIPYHHSIRVVYNFCPFSVSAFMVYIMVFKLLFNCILVIFLCTTFFDYFIPG